MTHGYAAFALDVLRARHAATPANNVFFSPFSLSAALSMTAAGARGETLAEMKRALRLEEGEEQHDAYATLSRRLLDAARDDVELRIANGLFAQQGFEIRAELLAVTRDKYDAVLELADFKQRFDDERKRINEWVAARTKGRIMDLIPRGSISDVTRLVLVNAIYFLGKWRTPFEK